MNEYIYNFGEAKEFILPTSIVTLSGYKLISLRNNFVVVYDSPDHTFLIPINMIDTSKIIQIENFLNDNGFSNNDLSTAQQAINLLSNFSKTK